MSAAAKSGVTQRSKLKKKGASALDRPRKGGKRPHFEAIDLDTTIEAIAGVSDPLSASGFGERIAAVILSKSETELAATVERVDDATMNKIIDVVIAASSTLKTRQELVESALARLCVVGEVMNQPARKAATARRT